MNRNAVPSQANSMLDSLDKAFKNFERALDQQFAKMDLHDAIVLPPNAHPWPRRWPDPWLVLCRGLEDLGGGWACIFFTTVKFS